MKNNLFKELIFNITNLYPQLWYSRSESKEKLEKNNINFCCLLLTFANSLDRAQVQRNVWFQIVCCSDGIHERTFEKYIKK